jgi:hypothetical protein
MLQDDVTDVSIFLNAIVTIDKGSCKFCNKKFLQKSPGMYMYVYHEIFN